MGVNRENMLLIVDPFGVPSSLYQHRALEYILRLEEVLSRVDRGLVQTVLITSILDLGYPDPLVEKAQAFVERGYFDEDDIIRFCWIHAPHAPILLRVYRQEKEIPLDGKKHIYLCGATAEICVLTQAKMLKKSNRGLDLSLVYDLTLCKSIPPLKSCELRRFYTSHEVPIKVIMSQNLPFLR